jgi:hypothetical protein
MSDWTIPLLVITECSCYRRTLKLVSMCDTTTGKCVFRELEKILEMYELALNKLVSLVTNGFPLVTNSKNGVLGNLDGKFGSKIHNFQYIIHQEVLCSKILTKSCFVTDSVSFKF